MPKEDDLVWLMDDDLPDDEPSDVLAAIPGMRQRVVADRPDDDLGLRAILEHPEVLSRSWRRSAGTPPPRRKPASTRRHGDALRAA